MLWKTESNKTKSKMCQKLSYICGYICIANSVPQRYILAAMSFATSMSMYMIRVCLAISMTQMVKPIIANVSIGSNKEDDYSCPMPMKEHFANNVTLVYFFFFEKRTNTCTFY